MIRQSKAGAMFLSNIHRVFPTAINCLIIAFKIAYISRIVSRETFYNLRVKSYRGPL